MKCCGKANEWQGVRTWSMSTKHTWSSTHSEDWSANISTLWKVYIGCLTNDVTLVFLNFMDSLTPQLINKDIFELPNKFWVDNVQDLHQSEKFGRDMPLRRWRVVF